MATKIIHKKSSVTNRVPVAADLEVGEIALNLTDQKIYSKQSDGTIVEMAPDGSSNKLPLAGGTVTGKLTLDKNDIAVPSLDFSTHSYDGNLAQKYRTNTSTAKYATFGTNNNLFEYNWDFTDCEDFCYTHSTNGKVASIDKNGIAAKKLYVADFAANTIYGRSLTNTIDVGARLATYQTALTNLRTNAASATTFDELKTAIANALANV